MKLFVWDLHGTLEQGNENAVVELSNIVLKQAGYGEQFSDEVGRRLYGLKWFEYFENLLPSEPHERHLELQAAAFDLSNSKQGVATIASYIKPSLNALDVLEVIHYAHKQIVISNTVPESLPMFLRVLGMSEFFDKESAFAVNQHSRDTKRTKIDVLNEYLNRRAFDEIIVIGDSEGDMLLADSVKAKAYLYAHNGLEFRSDKGHYKINNLKQVLVEI